MELSQIIEKAIKVRKLYSELEKNKYGREWNGVEIMQGFVGDVGDLGKLVVAKEGMRDIDNVDEKLSHELADCLWSILIIANRYGIDIEKDFLKTMQELEDKIVS